MRRHACTLVLGTQAMQLCTMDHTTQGYCTIPHSLARSRLVALESMQSVMESLLDLALGLTFESALALLGMVALALVLAPTLALLLALALLPGLTLHLAATSCRTELGKHCSRPRRSSTRRKHLDCTTCARHSGRWARRSKCEAPVRVRALTGTSAPAMGLAVVLAKLWVSVRVQTRSPRRGRRNKKRIVQERLHMFRGDYLSQSATPES